MKSSKSISSSFYILVLIFFFWGFVAASNGIFIPFCKSHFTLNQLQSQLIDTSFYGAYFLGALGLYFYSEYIGYDFLNRIGYKKAIIYGLCISGIGAISMALLAYFNIDSYYLILVSFFIIAFGFSLQQTAAQPLAIAMGASETGAHRLSLAGSVNSIGTLIGPLVVSWLLFGNLADAKTTTFSSIATLYWSLAGLFILAIIIFSFSDIRHIQHDQVLEKSPKASGILKSITLLLLTLIILSIYTPIASLWLIIGALLGIFGLLLWAYSQSKKDAKGWGAMQYPQLVLGMLAIFIYVGVEVSIQSNMGALLQLPQFGAMSEHKISAYISLYWGGLMIGRWIGAISVFNFSTKNKKILMLVIPYLAFAFYLSINMLKGNQVSHLYSYILVIPFLILAAFLGHEKPLKTLLFLSIFGAIGMLIGIFGSGTISLYALLSGGLFCSMMWPCIFSIATMGLEKYTSQGSAFLIMMILGGAILPPLQGALVDAKGIGTQLSYFVPTIGFLLLIVYAVVVKQSLRNQNINLS